MSSYFKRRKCVILLQFGQFNLIDSRGDGAFMTPLNKFLKANHIRFGNDLDPSIRKISGMAFYAQLLGFVPGKHPKINALHAAGYQQFNFTRHAVCSSNNGFWGCGQNLRVLWRR